MLTGLFTMFLNQTSSLFGPLVGGGGGDGINFFNQLMQQFMSVFGQVSGLWSNRVSRQMASWHDSIGEKDLPEYERVQTSVSSLSHMGSRLQTLSTASVPVLAMVKQIKETRQLMNDVWKCVDGVQRPELTLNVTVMGDEQLVRQGQQMIMQMQAELVHLWRLVSEQIVADVNHSKSAPDCKSVVECMVQTAMDSQAPPPESTSQSSSTQTIEFEETKKLINCKSSCCPDAADGNQ